MVKRGPKSKRSGPRTQIVRSSISTSMVPAAVGTRRLDRYIRFGNAVGADGGLQLAVCVPIYGIGASVTNGYGLIDSVGSRAAQADVSPVMAHLLCPQIARIASCFTQYRFQSLTYVYDPIGSSASAVRLAFGFSSDAYGPIDAATGTGGFNTILTTPQSVAFSPWMGWRLNCRLPPGMFYTYEGSTAVTANLRQACQGTIACVADSDPGATFSYGILWMECVLSLYDPIPMAASPALADRMASRFTARVKLDVDDAKVESRPELVVTEPSAASSARSGEFPSRIPLLRAATVLPSPAIQVSGCSCPHSGPTPSKPEGDRP